MHCWIWGSLVFVVIFAKYTDTFKPETSNVARSFIVFSYDTKWPRNVYMKALIKFSAYEMLHAKVWQCRNSNSVWLLTTHHVYITITKLCSRYFNTSCMRQYAALRIYIYISYTYMHLEIMVVKRHIKCSNVWYFQTYRKWTKTASGKEEERGRMVSVRHGLHWQILCDGNFSSVTRDLYMFVKNCWEKWNFNVKSLP